MIGTYFEYEFSSGTTVSTTDVTSSTLNVDSGGVTFTWSIQDPGGSNILGHFPTFAFPGGTADGSLVATVCGTSPSTPSDVVSLAMTDSNLFWEANSTEPLRLDFFAVAGTWDVVFHRTTGGTVPFRITQSTTTTTTTGPTIGPILPTIPTIPTFPFPPTGTSSPPIRLDVEIFITEGKYNKVTFTTSDVGGLIAVDDLEVIVNCFCRGTRISTPDGQRAVETLQPGDKLLLADGSETSVRWLGKQFIDTRLAHPRQVNPVCIKAGAIAARVPSRDLFVSGDHAISIDGYLIDANALVNGKTIFQVMKAPPQGFTYYHVETDAHELILAENTPAETFVDYLSPFAFDNADTRDRNAPIAEMTLPRVSSPRLVPQPIRQRLKDREDRLHPVPVAG